MDNKIAQSLLPAFAAEATSFGSRERERLRSPILALLSSHGLNQDGYTAPVYERKWMNMDILYQASGIHKLCKNASNWYNWYNWYRWFAEGSHHQVRGPWPIWPFVLVSRFNSCTTPAAWFLAGLSSTWLESHCSALCAKHFHHHNVEHALWSSFNKLEAWFCEGFSN